ncbi:hypothetical protein KXV65_006254 [Aspergillus fumigatus]|nr:hypothetical protein KXX22_005104 [Aspergillus fumigatus]KAH1574720.1 hypothetical protein KXX28_002283 [Aspergillus fumigatus]KAH1641924.1 hypothetical protein KXX59_000720 [Aspergillus fumigatus]KAH1789053.1 hypothetical protein KXX62_004651 [Aspergillus fumigatus]KAH1791886.1 hypothetical protein KXX20_006539 [Aspergillus fumigatus]
MCPKIASLDGVEIIQGRLSLGLVGSWPKRAERVQGKATIPQMGAKMLQKLRIHDGGCHLEPWSFSWAVSGAWWKYSRTFLHRKAKHGEVGSHSAQKRPRALAYQMWSARMELQTSKCIRYNQSPLLGPPGSPESGLIGSFSSEHAALLDFIPRTFGRCIADPSDAASRAGCMKQHVDHDKGDMSQESVQDFEAEHRRYKPQLRIDNSSCRSAEVRDSGLQAAPPGAVQSSPRSDSAERPRSSDKTNKTKKLRKRHQSTARHVAHGEDFKTSSRASRYLKIPQMNHRMGKSIQQAGFFEGPRKVLRGQSRSKISTSKEEQVGKRPSVTGKGCAVVIEYVKQSMKEEPIEAGRRR